jgi:anti-sigma B factor antagonist
MDLTLHADEQGPLPVLFVGGEIDLATLPRLRDRLVRMATDHPGATIAVDLAGVVFVDSAGLGVLVGGLGRMRAHGGDLVLVAPPERLADLLRLTGLDVSLRSFAAIEAAQRAIA